VEHTTGKSALGSCRWVETSVALNFLIITGHSDRELNLKMKGKQRITKGGVREVNRKQRSSSTSDSASSEAKKRGCGGGYPRK
jgi:hypothetical protein